MNKMHKHRDKRSDKLRIREEDLARELAEKARISSNDEETKEDKKRKKKERQRQQRQQLQLEKEQQQTLLEKQKQQELLEQKRLEELRRIQANTMEQTMPGMITIKRVTENGGSNASITIKLKGSTPEQDKLLYTLINNNSQTNNNNNNNNSSSNNSQANLKKKKSKNSLEEPPKKAVLEHVVNVEINNNSSNNTKKRKNKSDTSGGNTNKELKVTLVVDPPPIPQSKKDRLKNQKNSDLCKKGNKTQPNLNRRNSEPVDLPMLCLPPGITITKVNGPVINRNYKSVDLPEGNHPNATTITNIPVSKSGVIVVDTEKLIQQSNPNSSNINNTSKVLLPTAASKRRRRKKTKDCKEPVSGVSSKNTNSQSMVTLKNPMFQAYQSPQCGSEKNADFNEMSCQASIFKNENGMVTIRSSRLQQSLNNGAPLQSTLTDLKPIIGSDMPTPYIPPPSFPVENNGGAFNAEEILSGLPGIEITKFDKCAVRNENYKNLCQTADVSIIPTQQNGDKTNLVKEEWQLDSNLTAKDEEDMDADAARELEAFKCFCQQSVPPKRKEKVAHLNVKDIVLKKKNDKITL